MGGYSAADVPNQSGRTAVITGANTGIGFEAALVLAGKGARVVLGCRSEAKAQAARERIGTQHPDAEVALVPLDLGSLASVRDAAKQLEQEARIDLLINNAGLMVPPRQETADAFESQFGVNHLGHFALTGHLISKLRQNPGSRVVTVSSGAHKFGRIDFEDPHAEKSYNRVARYGMSKLANLLFSYELQRRLEAAGSETISLACHPGGSTTELSRHLPKPLLQVSNLVMSFFMQSAAEGALPTLRAATDPAAKGADYYGPDGVFEMAGPPVRVKSTAASHDRKLAERLWDLSIELTGVDPGL